MENKSHDAIITKTFDMRLALRGLIHKRFTGD
jgi:hypothetical protein